MKIRIYRTGIVLIPLLLLAACVHAQEEQVHFSEHSIESPLHLSPALKHLLIKEMQALQHGMMNLVPAIASGNWGQIAEIGSQIQDSYIIKQSLTDAQVSELHHALPPAFLRLDQSFHKSAGMLAHAAKMKNADVVNFYFYKLNDACVQCHSQFAYGRFPGLSKPKIESEHH